jgi:two-component sensor histidine kinase/ActR/RegA family two-component response regulator
MEKAGGNMKRSGAARVLYVEDDPVDRMAFARATGVGLVPWKVEIAASLAEAYTMLRQGSFDIIVSDYHLGDGTVFDLLTDWRVGETPVVVITGLGSEEIAVRALKSGAVDYLIKDVDRRYLAILPYTIENAIKVKEIKETLKWNEALLGKMAESSPLGHYVTASQSGKVLYWNAKFAQILGFPGEFGSARGSDLTHQDVVSAVTGRSVGPLPESFIHPKESDEESISGQPLTIPMSDGRTIRVLSTQMRDAQGSGIGTLFLLEDITGEIAHKRQLETALQEKEVLLREIHHRVKNNMQVISSLLNLQAMAIEDPEVLDLFKETQNRVRSLALIHERLYQTRGLDQIEYGDYLTTLTSRLFESYGVSPGRVRVEVRADPATLPIEKAIPCSLIVNELISNSLKYAFPQGREGVIEIAFLASGPSYTLRYHDNGVGLPASMEIGKTTTLGVSLISALTSQLGGQLMVDREGGTTFTIIFPKSVEKSVR